MPTNPKTLEDLCRWACTFNSWEWPEDYPVPKPDRFGRLRALKDLSLLIRPHREACAIIAGNKEVLRYWNVHHCQTMDDAEFEAFWERDYGGSQSRPGRTRAA